ncbi:uncharacterized protein LOC132278853 [Cornus florida]|uniref:uncharacterized protein LOC132278853 n=1 Tax=Cornus florida TaxID=4283 RepID=UPI00289A6B6F|nr:uncharacterized protein LOC132278853 [Cornus florida]
MLLRTSLSNTKKFFQNTINNIKSFLSDGYQRLPKAPPFNPFSCSRGFDDMRFSQSYNELDKFYTEFTNHWDRTKHKPKKRSKKKLLSPVSNPKKALFPENLRKFSKARPVMKNYAEENREDQKKKKLIVYEGSREEYLSCTKGVEEKRSCLVTQKLKELEMMDKSNVEHVLDIEEVLHYYSRLTSPVYLDIVDKFFMDMYAELFSLPESTSNDISRPMFRPVNW